MSIPGDDVPDPHVVTNHAITINAPPEAVWPWLVQMGWHRASWYTARLGRQAAVLGELAHCERNFPGLQEIISATSSQMERLKPGAASS